MRKRTTTKVTKLEKQRMTTEVTKLEKQRATTEVTKLEKQRANKPGTGETVIGRSTGKGPQVIVKLDQAALVQLTESLGESAADLWLAGKLDLNHPDE